MKRTTLLNSSLSAAIAEMGHTDSLVVGDCGLPVPTGVPRIDLAVTKGLPGFYPVLEAVLSELCVEGVCIAQELKDGSPEGFARLASLFEGKRIEVIAHTELKERMRAARAVVRTGECTPYLNIILYSGVAF